MIRNDVEELIAPTLEDMGYILWGCKYSSKGNHAMLRVYIEKSGGIRLEDCEQVSRRVSTILDVADLIRGQYTLEVSSPGIPKPLFHIWQYKSYIGHVVQIKLLAPIEDKRTWSGKILSAKDNVVTLITDDGLKEFIISNIAKASLTVE